MVSFHRPPTTDHRPPTTDHRPPTTDVAASPATGSFTTDMSNRRAILSGYENQWLMVRFWLAADKLSKLSGQIIHSTLASGGSTGQALTTMIVHSAPEMGIPICALLASVDGGLKNDSRSPSGSLRREEPARRAQGGWRDDQDRPGENHEEQRPAAPRNMIGINSRGNPLDLDRRRVEIESANSYTYENPQSGRAVSMRPVAEQAVLRRHARLDEVSDKTSSEAERN